MVDLPNSSAPSVQIVCGTDLNYAPHLAVLARSISRTNPSLQVTIHVLSDGITEQYRNLVEDSATNIKFVWYPVTDHKILQFKPFLQISRAAYMRLAMAEMLPSDLSKVLYLDVDVIVCASLESLWCTELGDFACGAVLDTGIVADKFAAKYDLVGPGSYFNSGVMLINLTSMRQNRWFDKAIDLIDKNDFEFADQDALNIVLWGRWLSLDAIWNFQRRFLYEGQCPTSAAHRAPAIIHFTEQEKPWHGTEWHPYQWVYLKNLWSTHFWTIVTSKSGIGLYQIVKAWAKYYRHRIKQSFEAR